MVVVRKNGMCLRYTSKDLRNDRDIVTEAIKQNYNALQYASRYIKHDSCFIEIANRYRIGTKKQ